MYVVNKHMVKIALFVFYYTICIIAFPQNYSINTYSVNEGLAQSTVYSICSDSRGFIWFSTYGGGVSKYDGTSFKTLTEQDGLGSNQVYKIFEDT